MTAVELRGVTKDFPVGLRGARLRALDRVSLRIDEGQVYGLLGPNGSGKSTALKLMLGLIEPTAGSCRIFGVPSGEARARRMVGYLPESPEFYRFLTGRELVAFYGGLGGMGGRALRDRVDEVIGWVGLARDAERRVGTYSKGMLQRIGLAQALVHRPRLVILDEPTAGVDPTGAAAMAEMIGRLKAEGATLLITSHLLGEMEALCDRVALLDQGRLVLEGAVDELIGDTNPLALGGRELPPEDRAELEGWLGARGGALVAVNRRRSRLETIFLEKVGRRPR